MFGNLVCYGYIFARGGSKGLPGKNIKPLCGRPLIAYSIEALKASKYVDRVIVSTDDARISSAAREWGAEVPFERPAELASDASPEILSWKHALREAEREGGLPGIMVSAPTTSPMRSPEDIDAAIETLAETGADQVISVTPAQRSPYFNMVTRDADGRSAMFAELPRPVARRQDAPPVYDVTTVVYASRPEYIAELPEEVSFLSGDVRSIVVPRERALDIDDALDFEFAEFLMAKRKGGERE